MQHQRVDSTRVSLLISFMAFFQDCDACWGVVPESQWRDGEAGDATNAINTLAENVRVSGCERSLPVHRVQSVWEKSSAGIVWHVTMSVGGAKKACGGRKIFLVGQPYQVSRGLTVSSEHYMHTRLLLLLTRTHSTQHTAHHSRTTHHSNTTHTQLTPLTPHSHTIHTPLTHHCCHFLSANSRGDEDDLGGVAAAGESACSVTMPV
jgi:hypothetical protein